MQRFFKWLAAALTLVAIVLGTLVVNAIWFRPFSIRVAFERTFLVFALKDPELLTSIGLLDGLGFRGHNAELTDASPDHDRWLAEFTARELETLRSYDRRRLTGQTALSYDILEWYLDQTVRGVQYLWHAYPVTQFRGSHLSLPDLLARNHRITDRKGAEHYVARLEAFGEKFDQIVANLRHRESMGIVPPRFVALGVADQCRAFLEPPVQENVLFTSFVERLADVDKNELDPQERDRFTARVEAAIRESVHPAYEALAQHMRELAERVETDHGVWALPNGDAYYDHLLRGHTTTGLDADTIHARGLAEMERIQGEMDGILRSEGYVDGTVAERMVALADEERFHWPDSDAGREAILEEYRRLIDEIEGGMDLHFLRLPRAEVEVVRIPEFREAGAAAASYQGPSLDGSRPGRFFVNLRDPREHPRFGMPTLAYHEAVPGHHFQTSLQAELEGVPQFRRLIPFTAFSEGWALYAERVAKEAGFQEDPYGDLGRLQAELFRAVRLVVDTGIHRQRWTREEAIATMREATGMGEREVTTEIERYFVLPGQATAYKVGMMEILDLRRRAEEALADRFDLRVFHDRVLRNGDMPLELLEREIEAWIAETGS